MVQVPEQYPSRRTAFEEKFHDLATHRLGEDSESVSPSGNYRLSVSGWDSWGNAWGLSRGVVADNDGVVIADIIRNYSEFWFAWSMHSNGKEYLLCGEDYQGYNVVNLTDRVVHLFIPEEQVKGNGFCWIEAAVSPNSKLLAVRGCYWACPFELHVYNFEDPDTLPFQRIFNVDVDMRLSGWDETSTKVLLEEDDMTRVSDGASLASLPDDEWDAVVDSGEISDEDLWKESIITSTIDIVTGEPGEGAS